MGAQELSSLLWKERELLELLTFKLEEEQLILTSGNTRWLQHATREVEQVVERLRSAGLGRTVEAAALAKEWGIDEDASLRDIAAKAPAGPWAEIFAGHLKALGELTMRIRELRDANDQFLRAAARSTQETVAGLAPDAGTYDSRGGTGLDAGARLFDKDL
ncbi:flagellar protein FlgN [Arthrobacter sp. H14-L1]|uniref:flagellar protein FlgN n=1 Tax=Arthrobacter sp. H14-L1 TaxID=2996697 RepID=UPI00226DA86D|nr:flagellar protein FlgN [Arthrobacter sp. H14-L1]MCY0903372.1 flagellar protein FlgN [Arthrobacter sp. H14-L1]